MTWTEERIAELMRLWEAGHSASAIGKMLGVSKNAVVGKAHRMRLASRPSPIRRTQTRRRKRTVAMPTRPKAPPKTVVEEPPKRPPVRRVMRINRNGAGCLWPLGDPGDEDFHFCGAPAVEGKPYCEEHCARAYISRVRSEPEAA